MLSGKTAGMVIAGAGGAHGWATKATATVLEWQRSAFLKQPLAVEERVLDGVWEPPGDRAPYESRLYSEFAGILQVEIR
jgi:hypothetical protein